METIYNQTNIIEIAKHVFKSFPSAAAFLEIQTGIITFSVREGKDFYRYAYDTFERIFTRLYII